MSRDLPDAAVSVLERVGPTFNIAICSFNVTTSVSRWLEREACPFSMLTSFESSETLASRGAT